MSEIIALWCAFYGHWNCECDVIEKQALDMKQNTFSSKNQPQGKCACMAFYQLAFGNQF